MSKKFQITLEGARKNIGYTQEEAAKLFGVPYQTLVNWERDNSNMPANAIAKIPYIYHIPKNSIFFGDKNEFIRCLNVK